MMHKRQIVKGFTLIELSIVLVVIGLIVGGVLVGRDLITAAAVRAQIAQIEKYQTAVNTFRGKYGYLPGDIRNPEAPQFGFLTRGTIPGAGDGNGILEGVMSGGNNDGLGGAMGENPMVWMDLSTAHLIDGNFNLARPDVVSGWGNFFINAGSTPPLGRILPAAKLGHGNYYNYIGTFSLNGFNYFTMGIGEIYDAGDVSAAAMLTVRQAYMMDAKMDDGFPQKGRVIPILLGGALGWAANDALHGNYGASSPEWPGISGNAVSSVSPDATTCYDNDGASGPMHYSIGVNNGMGINCSLSFRLQ